MASYLLIGTLKQWTLGTWRTCILKNNVYDHDVLCGQPFKKSPNIFRLIRNKITIFCIKHFTIIII
jgi:hypothetical protein